MSVSSNIPVSKRIHKQVRFSIGVPIDLAIKMDMDRDRTKTSRANWISSAIESKIKSSHERQQEKEEWKKMREEINGLKKIITDKLG